MTIGHNVSVESERLIGRVRAVAHPWLPQIQTCPMRAPCVAGPNEVVNL